MRVRVQSRDKARETIVVEEDAAAGGGDGMSEENERRKLRIRLRPEQASDPKWIIQTLPELLLQQFRQPETADAHIVETVDADTREHRIEVRKPLTGRFEGTRQALKQCNWPDTWNLFSYFLPKTAREDVFEPSQQDMLRQYWKAKRKCKHWVARLIINLAFTFRFALLTADCWRSLCMHRVIKWFTNPPTHH